MPDTAESYLCRKIVTSLKVYFLSNASDGQSWTPVHSISAGWKPENAQVAVPDDCLLGKVLYTSQIFINLIFCHIATFNLYILYCTGKERK